jgi:hypothetical protein
MEIAAQHSPFVAEKSSLETSPKSKHNNNGVLARLNGLLDLAPYELEALYIQAKTPQLNDVGGDLRGRMLAWPVLVPRPRIQSAIRAFAGAATFPWKGKSFTPDPQKGEGINRVFSDRFRLFRFETFIAKSRAGDFDALQLDYDLAGNPPVIRSIKDEIREIEPDLWLGQAYYQTTKSDWLWLYFALARVR